MKRKLAIALGIVAVVVLVLALGAMYLISHMFSSKPAKPLPTGSVMTEARSKANRDVAGSFEDVDAYCARAAITYYDTGTLDECEPGHHNWKVNTIFENRCRYVMAKYYGFSGDFRVAVVQLDSALVGWGWARHGGGLPYMLTGYYDRWHGPDPPRPGNVRRPRLVSNLPGVQYNRGSLRLFIQFEERDTSGAAFARPFVDTPLVTNPLLGELSYQEARVVDRDKLFPTILEENRYILMIAIMADNYFVN